MIFRVVEVNSSLCFGPFNSELLYVGGGMIKLGKSNRLWRPLIGVVVAYAVAAQALLIALGGFSLPAQAHDGAPGFELCLHDSQAVPELPAGNPDHYGCTHCIFCFAGSHHAVIAAPLVVFHRAYVEIVDSAVGRGYARPSPSLPRIR